ncbi:MAG: NAD-dependent succinate-semialdehyde dehydrogenase [Ktedonobacteraceae bacterium]|nr:NAD-dependent succinate-semialdehyde dehydrogenase [Ktedonobacteraceae bacterium]
MEITRRGLLEKLWIGGEARDSQSRATYPLTNPYTGTVTTFIAKGAAADALDAINAARQAFQEWSKKTGNERANTMYKAYHLLRQHRQELEDLLIEDLGKTRKEASKEIRSTGAFIRYCAEEARRISGDLVPSPDAAKRVVVIPQPVGIVVAITASNAPGILFGRKVAPALAAGCTVIVKPSEETPRVTLLLASIFAEAGLPAGAVNVVMGDAPVIVRVLVQDSRVAMVTFTGSVQTGRLIMRLASDGPKRVLLELGGVAPFIVFSDADLQGAIEGLVAAKFRHAGQICASPQRVFVEESMAGEFRTRLIERFSHIRVGNPVDQTTDYGPLQHHHNLEKVEHLIADAKSKGAKVLTGGESPGGYLFLPTLLEGVTDDMAISREEAFGPVIVLETFRGEEEVIERSNNTAYGLGAYVYTEDLSRAWRLAEALEVGIVGINDPFPATVEGPFGGVKQSGFGLEGGKYGVEAFLIKKQVSFQIS